VVLLLKSDKKCYGTLMAELINSYTCSQDVYPNNTTGAYDMLVNYHSPTSHACTHVQDHGLAFAQDLDVSGCGGRGSHGGHGGSGRGGHGPGRGGGDTNANATATSSRNNNNTNEQVAKLYTACSLYDSRPAECFLQNSTISILWILIDSCSSVNMFANAELLHDIKPTNNPINIHCNTGTISVRKTGLLGNYPEWVWFNPKGIANILLLDNVSKHYQVTMDTNESNSITLHCKDGSLIHFSPCSKGLYRYALPHNESLSDFWSMISTVAGNAKQFTQRQYKNAILARRVQNIIMRTGTCEFMDVSINHIRNCPINKQHIQMAETIFGPNLGSLKGKTTYHAPPHVDGHITPVPHDILAAHHHIHLTVNIMYVNKLPFLITYSHSLCFGTVELLENRQIPTIRKKLQSAFNLYHHRGFIITKLYADPEFEAICPWFPCLDTCGANDHIPDIELFIRTVKDRSRSTYRMLPFKYIPCIVLIQLVKNVIFWLNSFPARDGVSTTMSPRCIMTGQEIDYNKHVCLEFGEYVQTHEEHDNAMTNRTLGAICLGLTGSEHGTHWFMCVASGA
jgi:hypothetical protein